MVLLVVLLIVFRSKIFKVGSTSQGKVGETRLLNKDKNLLTVIDHAVTNVAKLKDDFNSVEKIGASIVSKNKEKITNKTLVQKKHNRYRDIGNHHECSTILLMINFSCV